MIYLNNYIWWSISGLLLGIGFVVPALWIISLFGGAFFIFLLQKEINFLNRFFGAWLAWTIKSACATSVFWSVYPIDWLPLEIGNIQIPLIFIYWSTASLWLGAGAVLLAGYFWLIKNRFNFWQLSKHHFLITLIWVASESLGSLIFSIMMYGPGGAINTSYSLGYSGYLLANHEILLQTARLAGVYSLSLLFVVLSMGLLFCIKNPAVPFKYTYLVILLLVYGTGFVNIGDYVKDNVSDVYKVVTVDTRLNRGIIDKKSEAATVSVGLRDAVRVAMDQKADYILLPEGAQLFDQTKSDGFLKSLFKLQYEKSNTVVIDTGITEIGDKTVLQALIYNPDEDKIEKVQKRYLVPQGEFMPSLYKKFLQLFSYGDAVDYVADAISYEVGPNTNQALLSENLPGILFCFESVSPTGIYTLLNERPDIPFVAHPVSHGWFHDSPVLLYQLDAMLKVQAVWGNKYIVSAGNYVDGRLITPYGEVQELSVVEEGSGWVVRETTIPRRR